MTNDLPDIQNSEPEIKVELQKVGIQDLKLPISIIQKDHKLQSTVANIDSFIVLDKNNRGANMSRIPIILTEYSDKIINQRLLNELANKIRLVCETTKSIVKYEFPYFVEKKSPVTNLIGKVYSQVEFILEKTENNTYFEFKVKTHGTSLCPCSKEISDLGAHNQRCDIIIGVRPKLDEWIWIEDIIDIANQSCSCEIYSILKRPDEKYVTENAYNNPLFCEDITRRAYSKLSELSNIETFNITVVSDESIHQHKAYASLY